MAGPVLQIRTKTNDDLDVQKKEFTYKSGDSKVFEIEGMKDLHSISVNGVELSESQYNYTKGVKKVQILDSLEHNDYVIIKHKN